MAVVVCKSCNKYTPTDRDTCLQCGQPVVGGEALPEATPAPTVAERFNALSPLTVSLVGGLGSVVLFAVIGIFFDAGEDRIVGPSPAQLASRPSASSSLTEVRLQRMARESVQEYLKDPSSAEFRNQKGPCGEVNSRNSFGAMTGFQRFMAAGDLVFLERDSGIELSEFNEAWNRLCL